MKRHQEDDEPPPEPSPRPPAYEIEEAFEQALSPIELPRHTDDQEDDQQDTNQHQNGNSRPASIFGDAAANGNGNQPDTAAEQPQSTEATAIGLRSEALPLPRAQATTDAEVPPESLTERLWPLPQWMQRYVVALMDLGGNEMLAAGRCKVSLRSVTKYQKLLPDFAAACQEAAAWATGIVKASLFQSATIGDLEAVYRGPYLVGWKRNKSVKAAELLLQMSGDIQKGGTSVTLRQDLHVEQVQDAEIPRIVGDVVARLFGGNKGRPVLEAQAVETGDGVST